MIRVWDCDNRAIKYALGPVYLFSIAIAVHYPDLFLRICFVLLTPTGCF